MLDVRNLALVSDTDQGNNRTDRQHQQRPNKYREHETASTSIGPIIGKRMTSKASVRIVFIQGLGPCLMGRVCVRARVLVRACPCVRIRMCECVHVYGYSPVPVPVSSGVI